MQGSCRYLVRVGVRVGVRVRVWVRVRVIVRVRVRLGFGFALYNAASMPRRDAP